MTIDSNLLTGLSYGFGAGLLTGLGIGLIVLLLVAKSVKLPWW